MYDNQYEGKIKGNRERRIKKRKRRKINLVIFSVLFLIILIFILRYFSIFPFSSNLLSFKRINILFIGCDEIENHGRADTIAFLSISPKTKDALILSIPPEERASYNVSSIKKLLCSSAPARVEHKKGIMEYFQGVELYEGYGSTEAGIVTTLLPRQQLAKPASIEALAIGWQTAMTRHMAGIAPSSLLATHMCETTLPSSSAKLYGR